MDQVVEKKPQVNDRKYDQPKINVLIGILLWAAFVDGLWVFLPDDPVYDTMTDYLFGLPCIFLIYVWCQYDAIEKKFSMGKAMKIFLVFLTVIAFPIYLFRTRGLGGGFKTICLSILFFFVMGMVTDQASSVCFDIAEMLGIFE